AFPQDKVVLIAGGKDKGTSLGDLIDVAKKRCAAVILIGEATGRFQAEFNQHGIENIFPVATLEAAVKMGLELRLGPVVLSPACSSFDMFKNYEERGRVFKDIVRERGKEVAAGA
ncbi:MAG TPA: UDP-N-acetylmuramoyl-L-alanine--D-glutamate ligase, partial [Candidatus Melainabacteria bacterium]|nr:UDP-N-acetylmuramoyl-L-alanine--D-glutamate ligase [Candidatus Melainabacteria bacterium]